MNTWQDEEFKLSHEIIPSPGTEDKEWPAIEKKIEVVKPFVKTVHIDVLDGKYADNTTFLDPKPFAKFTKDLFFEVHLMVDNPLQYLRPFAEAGFKRFIGQVEKMPDVAEFLAEGQLLGEAGLAIDKQTAVEEIKVSFDDLDVLLVITIQAGFSGQQFLPELLEKVKAIREKAPQLPIEVDGGINDKTIVSAREKGATRFVTTSFLFGAKDPRRQYELLRNLVEGL
jgi:ribulose-phosphate 3-epimerase